MNIEQKTERENLEFRGKWSKRDLAELRAKSLVRRLENQNWSKEKLWNWDKTKERKKETNQDYAEEKARKLNCFLEKMKRKKILERERKGKEKEKIEFSRENAAEKSFKEDTKFALIPC